MTAPAAAELGWWTLHGETFLELLRRAHLGEDPDMLYAEEYANAEHLEIDGDD